MSDQLHPGVHPEPDSLNAFIEGVLPEHERLACMAHLADCELCRRRYRFEESLRIYVRKAAGDEQMTVELRQKLAALRIPLE